MYWTLELASYLEDAPWPATKDELIDFAMRTGAPLEVVENLQEIEDEGESYETIEDIWPDYPTKEDFFFNEDEYWRQLKMIFAARMDPLHSGFFVPSCQQFYIGPVFKEDMPEFSYFWFLFLKRQYLNIDDRFHNQSL